MLITWSYENVDILDKRLRTESQNQFMLLCFIIFIINIFPYFLDSMYISLKGKPKISEKKEDKIENDKEINPTQRQFPLVQTDNKLLDFGNSGKGESIIKYTIKSFFYNFVKSCMHIFAMLLIMSMNGFIIVSSVLGITVGKVIVSMSIFQR